MAGDQTRGRKGFKRSAQAKVNYSTKPKRRKRLSQNLTATSKERARVNIGLALNRWRAVKAAKGLKSDAEVAHCLLDAMKRLPSRSASSRASVQKMQFSQSEVQTLIEQEVCRVVKKNESKLQSLKETIQQLDRGVDYESSMNSLEARIDTVTNRAEAAIAFMRKTQKKSPQSSDVDMGTIRSRFKEEAMDTRPQNKMSMKFKDKNGSIFEIMETTKTALKNMRADNEALTAAIADLSEELPPPVLTPYGSPASKRTVRIIKTEPEEQLENDIKVKEPEDELEKCIDFKEPKAASVKVEGLAPDDSNSPKHRDPNQEELLYPPLPPTTFPAVLNMEAASFNIPPRPKVQLALIRKTANLSVLWDAEYDPSAPPMDSYSVYMTMERVKGSGVFPNWKSCGNVRAIPLPMCVMVNKYKPGRKVCVAVVGKDTFGRYGPYSEVVIATIPD